MAIDLNPGDVVKVRRFGAVACRVVGFPKVWEPTMVYATDPETGDEYETEDPDGEGEWVDDAASGRVVVIMVGDDTRHTVDADDCTAIAREDYCGECGQIGCTHDGLDRDDRD